jgi:hypothetical protein
VVCVFICVQPIIVDITVAVLNSETILYNVLDILQWVQIFQLITPEGGEGTRGLSCSQIWAYLRPRGRSGRGIPPSGRALREESGGRGGGGYNIGIRFNYDVSSGHGTVFPPVKKFQEVPTRMVTLVCR